MRKHGIKNLDVAEKLCVMFYDTLSKNVNKK
jgi:hypothetical protein